MKALASLDPGLSPEAIKAAFALFAPLVPHPAPDESDMPYGPDERHRYDLYRPAEESDLALLFVPGGGFTGSEKSLPGQPFHGNVGRAAADRGAVAAVMNYRLAPRHRHPVGAEDVAACAAALLARTGARRLCLAGHSAGACHVADCVAAPRLRPAALHGVAVVSGIYEPAARPVSPGRAAYYQNGAPGSLAALADWGGALFVASAERDPAVFVEQAETLAAACGTVVHIARGHTHISEIAAVGSAHDALSRAMFAALGPPHR